VQVLDQPADQRLDEHLQLPEPAGQCGARERHAEPCELAFLAVQRLVIEEFADRHMGKQSRRRHTLVDRLGGKRRGVHRFAVPAAVFRADMATHEEARRDQIELLADLLADLL
jgi:hypothetical protein